MQTSAIQIEAGAVYVCERGLIANLMTGQGADWYTEGSSIRRNEETEWLI